MTWPTHILSALTHSAERCVTAFEPLAFPKGFGFDPFTIEDCMTFFNTPSQFNFKLKKEKGKGILYGKQHVAIRQQLLNHLSTEDRLTVMRPTLDHFQILEKCHSFIQEQAPLVDITDIGMSHSVYHLSFETSHGIKGVVVKEEQLTNQSFYCQLLQELGWPSYHSTHVEDHLGCWEIADYLGPNTLYKTLKAGTHREHIETQLAQHAALGAITGRGDRHIENYVVYGQDLMPVDISYLFWHNNDEWTFTYVSGGMYEINHVIDYIDTPQRYTEKIDSFFKVYTDTLHQLANQQSTIINLINNFYWDKHPDTQRKIQFVTERTQDPQHYAEAQIQRYNDALAIAEANAQRKQALEQEIQNTPSLLEDPKTKMYALANEDRYGSFFLT